ncbi:MAG: carboxypeptidase regulatory-like domain-containing protein [Sedimentisphaerales bacterium]
MNEWVSSAQMVRYRISDQPLNFQLELKNGAELWGIVKSESTNKPIKDCVVSITTVYMSGYSMQVTTDANGLYRFRNLPPAEYKITAQNHDYFKYEERSFSLENRIIVSSGQKYKRDLKLKKRMTFEGKVVDLDGKPVAGAIVAIDEAYVSENQFSPFVVHTDEKGNFSITTGHIDTTPVPKLKGIDALKQ